MRIASLAILLTLYAATASAGQSTAQTTAKPATSSGASSSGQADPAEDYAKQVRQALRNNVSRGAMDPRIGGKVSAPVNSFAIEVGAEGEAVGKAKLSWQLETINSSMDVILKGPITKGAGVPLTDRGLASGASATLGYTLNLWQSSVDKNTASAARRATPGETTELGILKELISQGSSGSIGSDPNSRVSVNRQAFQGTTRNARLTAAALRQKGLVHLDRTFSVSTQVGVGSKTFKFAELEDPIVEKSETHTDKAFSVDFAFTKLTHKDKEGDEAALDVPHFLLSAGYARSKSFSVKPPRQICLPLGVASAQECKSIVFGAPTAATAKSIEIDGRAWAYAQKLGFNPHFSYDIDTKEWTSEMGLSYLVLQEAKAANELPKLNGKAMTVGVRVGYRSAESGGPYAAVFFGTVLGLN